MTKHVISLDDKYTETTGRVYLTGTQALVRLPMTQMRRDRAAGLNTAALVTGYRGSPLGAYDQQLIKAQHFLDQHDVTFQPGLNEDLSATAIWGTQQSQLSPGANRDGVVGIWYGKGPGVDRSGDVFKHGNAAGTSAHGGVLCLAGDDHTCKSSTIPHQSDHAFMSAIMPCLYPASVHEFLELGLLGIAMSRYSGCWVGMKVISETIETTSVVDLAQEQRGFVIPDDFELPQGGLNLRWPDAPLIQDARLQEQKGYAAIAFARANGVNEVTLDSPNARFGIVASGKAYEDVCQALDELGIGDDEARAIGLRLYKVRMTWPLEPAGIRQFSQGLEEVLIIEERREIVEHQIKQQLFNWRADVRPRIVGKFDHEDKPFLSLAKGLTVGAVGRAIAKRLLQFEFDDGLRAQIAARLERLIKRGDIALHHTAPVDRAPHFCAGCPHNTSTKVPEGSRALAGIGCHYMANWMDRSTETFTQMGGEGVPWTTAGRYTDEKHVFVNLGDGTYFHSGSLAIRQSVAARSNITYKILYNDAVAMTGGQPLDGDLTPAQITHQLYHEGVKPIYLLAETPGAYRARELAPHVIVKHRDEIDRVMKSIRREPGVSAILYVQTCAAEKRRRRKRGLMEDPGKRMVINDAVCEGCGDCSVQSNCIAIDPLETPMGRKRQINQSTCNMDYSCVKGFCPSFITITGGKLRKPAASAPPSLATLPAPRPVAIEGTYNIAVTGVGGTGVLTIGALIAMAAHVEGKSPIVMDMAGLAQKGGAVLSHIRIAADDTPIKSPKIATGGANVLLAADTVVAASRDGITVCDPERTHGVVNARVTPTSDFVRQRDFDFKAAQVERTIRDTVINDTHFHDFAAIARAVAGDEIASNIIMLGYALQCGLVPISAQAVEQAIELNGVAVKSNIDAFRWGRVLAHAPGEVQALAAPKKKSAKPLADMTLEEIIAHRSAHLTDYQDAAYADRYRAVVSRTQRAVNDRLGTDARASAIVRTVAINYAKLLAYKDEYEVARLLSAPDFRARIAATFDGDYRLAFNLAPPMLPGRDPNGRPRKREFSGRLMPVFERLARMKKLRGSRFDMFAGNAERKAERALIAHYEQDLNTALNALAPATAGTVAALLAVPQEIRGFGPVKEAAMARAATQRKALLTELESAPTNDADLPIAAE